MFEYVDTGSIVMGTLIIVMLFLLTILVSGKAIHENRKTKAPYFFLGATALVIALIIGEGFDTKNTIEKNIALFQNGSELKCATFGTLYLVSSQTGWRLHKDSFLLDARFCEK
jgi:hypothetical protein